MAHNRVRLYIMLATLVIPVVAGPMAAAAATLRVEANGADTTTCGPATAPCRTINQAITNAASGDTVLVGPGQYPQVTVGKPLTLVSSGGADVTVIDAGGGAFGIDVVSNDVTIGRPGDGFTVTGATLNNLSAGIQASGVTGVTVSSSIVTGNMDGIAITGNDIEVSGCVVSGNLNRAMEVFSGVGLQVVGSVAVVGNVAAGNGRDGIIAHGAPLTVRGNVARDNGRFGIRALFETTGVVRDNVAVANADAGFEVTGGASTDAVLVTRNSSLSNRTGVSLVVGPGRSMAVTGNNLYDNHDGCGLVLEFPAPLLDATGNFWGAPTGPGGGSADTVCRGSSQVQLPNTSPFLRAPAVVRPVKPRL